MINAVKKIKKKITRVHRKIRAKVATSIRSNCRRIAETAMDTGVKRKNETSKQKKTFLNASKGQSASPGSPVAVSPEADALSHSATTMKLTESFEIFHLLERSEGVKVRDANILKVGTPDCVEGFQLEYGSRNVKTMREIEKKRHPFKLVENELQTFSDSRKELVSCDQPILNNAATKLFKKRYGKRFRPRIVQLVTKAFAAAHSGNGTLLFLGEFCAHQDTDSPSTEKVGWEWSGASAVELESGVVTYSNHNGSAVWRLEYGSRNVKTRREIEKIQHPFKLVENEMNPFSDYRKELVSSDKPILNIAATKLFTKTYGKRFRPTIFQLVTKAFAAAHPGYGTLLFLGEFSAHQDTDSPSTEKMGWSGASAVELESGVVTSSSHKGSAVWRRQAQLGQIVEMIHVASLIHNDVLEEADTIPGGEGLHKLHSNKVVVLAGDDLVARASMLLAHLENTPVVQTMATALESLGAGEIMQLRPPPENLCEMEIYLKKNSYKTGRLICNACRSTKLLGGHAYGRNVATACKKYGFHLGLAYQIQDEIINFPGLANVIGKPPLADKDLGLSTSPMLYAAQEFPNLRK